MGSKLILVVDDDPDILTLLKDNLELDGYRVATAANGRKALNLFHELSVALIILDLALPDIDGIGICRTIRESSDVPIIMLTARDRVPDRVLGLQMGADDYLVKPFAYPELAARIKARLRRRNTGAAVPAPVDCGDLSIDPATRTVSRNGERIELTPTEFGLLLFLAQNRGKAVARRTILDTLWPSGEVHRGSRTVDVHIQHLRSKLEHDPTNPVCIMTVQGVGYLFCGKSDCP
ncbi:response regulator [Thermodesulfobacteriota bacterium]